MENSSELKLDFHSITRFSSSPFKTTFENISDIQVHSLVSLPGESRVSLLKHLAHSHFLHSKKKYVRHVTVYPYFSPLSILLEQVLFQLSIT